MKNYKLPLMGFVLVLVIESCKKEDVQQSSSKTTAIETKGSWTSLSNWSSVKADDSTTTHFSQIADTSISASVANSGLVLVFKKNGGAVQPLPFEDKATGTYWYYQISKGALRIDGSDNGLTQRTFSEQYFSYFIFTPEKIAALNVKGKTKFDLMQLTYQQALELSK